MIHARYILKDGAKGFVSKRGHRIGAWENQGKYSYAQCSNCNMEVQINTNPLPNEIAISGEAVARECANQESNNPHNHQCRLCDWPYDCECGIKNIGEVSEPGPKQGKPRICSACTRSIMGELTHQHEYDLGNLHPKRTTSSL